jgi:hypothetical protein
MVIGDINLEDTKVWEVLKVWEVQEVRVWLL